MTAPPIHLDPTRRHDFVLLFDVTDGNPNGDPDAGNLPRVDPETMQGLVSDVSLKRKVRDYVDAARGTEKRFKIYVSGLEALNETHQRAYSAIEVKSTGRVQKQDDVARARKWMTENFYDIRMFGAVMSTGVNAGQVRGPMQVVFGRSIESIMPLDLSITRKAVTREEERKVEVDAKGVGTGGKQTEMGRKALVPYGLYRAHGFFNPHFAAQTGADAADLALFWQALLGMFDIDRSAARGLMAMQGIYVFSHDCALGNAPAHKLFERVHVTPAHDGRAARSIHDYRVEVNDALPAGVTLTRLIEPGR